MRKIKMLLGVCTLSASLFVSCSKENPYEEELNPQYAVTEIDTVEQSELIERLRATLPENAEEKLRDFSGQFRFIDGQFTNQVKAAIDGDQYECSTDDLPLTEYTGYLTEGWSLFEALVYTFYGDIPTYYALFLDEDVNKRAYFGPNGEYTNQVQRTFKDLSRFWDINAGDMELTGMHFDTYLDLEKSAKTLQLLYGGTIEENMETAEFLKEITEEYETLNRENGAIFTFNAFAFKGQEVSPLGFIPDKIVMGDGIMQGMDAIGFGDVAAQAILAHEFGHQIQYDNGYFVDVDPEDEPEATRRTELMADAYAAYYLTHKRGATMNWKRVKKFMEVFYNIGDCGFTSSGHHGTPNQRMAAAKWAYELAQRAHKKGHILSSQEFYELFEEKLPELVAPDAEENLAISTENRFTEAEK
ncbi:hypothetical protein [Sinomicrobium weinanense]|uniref:Uncharacterized protein n=1 Tax=Sinomicrobium weinanense TaxID=2842200 RepID=A0A926Q2D8_9FLAO|nr:hypothetical protein [Sinomicrobium weinanense]MBC9796552.1 hypothetical protein [Sinomicrobium weinanense]MBU3123061.1 neutral zinc metallopeptidase [Sinomicrobium weinanense]